MADLLTGKGMYIWQIKNCGTPEKIAADCQAMGLSYAMIKIADGTTNYNMRPVKIGSITYWRDDIIQPVVDALRAKNIKVWGWGYAYLYSPTKEAQKAVERIKKFGMDGYVINSESQAKGKYSAALSFMKEYRRLLPNFPTAISSYRFPSFHPTFPWKEFLKYCDINMPQVYWLQAHNPAFQLQKTVADFATLYAKIGVFRKIVPTGAAFEEHGWVASASELDSFHEKAVELAATGKIIPSENWWELSFAQKLEFIPVIAAHKWIEQAGGDNEYDPCKDRAN